MYGGKIFNEKHVSTMSKWRHRTTIRLSLVQEFRTFSTFFRGFSMWNTLWGVLDVNMSFSVSFLVDRLWGLWMFVVFDGLVLLTHFLSNSFAIYLKKN